MLTKYTQWLLSTLLSRGADDDRNPVEMETLLGRLDESEDHIFSYSNYNITITL